MTRIVLAALLSLALAPAFPLTPGGSAFAQAGHQGHGAARPSANEPASTREFRAVNDRMHRDMAIRFTGNADRDFAAAMIPHHQGAIEMARIQLRHGTDPGMRKLAEEVIAAQQAEIARLRAFHAMPAPQPR